MIGKPQWFTYKIFGWGIMPTTRQGWAYVLISMVIAGILLLMPVSTAVEIWLPGIFIAAMFFDILHIMVQLQGFHDERKNYHQLIIERNVFFAAASAVIGVMLFQTYQNRDILGLGHVPFDLFLAVVLGIMILIKVLSPVYVRVKYE